jgi:hypothetical protein
MRNNVASIRDRSIAVLKAHTASGEAEAVPNEEEQAWLERQIRREDVAHIEQGMTVQFGPPQRQPNCREQAWLDNELYDAQVLDQLAGLGGYLACDSPVKRAPAAREPEADANQAAEEHGQSWSPLKRVAARAAHDFSWDII